MPYSPRLAGAAAGSLVAPEQEVGILLHVQYGHVQWREEKFLK
jgi:hypothetical protein